MCITTGRPSALREQDNIAHVSRSPEPGLQADRAPDVYYNSLIELSGLQSDILSELYPRRSVSIKADIRLIRHTIETLNERLEEWSSKLPTELQLDNDNESRADHVIQARLINPVAVLQALYTDCATNISGPTSSCATKMPSFSSSVHVFTPASNGLITKHQVSSVRPQCRALMLHAASSKS